MIVTRGHSEILASDHRQLILSLAQNSVPAHGPGVEMIHLSWAETHPRIDSLYGHLSREVVNAEVITPGLLCEDCSRTNRLQYGLLVLDFGPGLLRRVNLEYIKEELAGDHG